MTIGTVVHDTTFSFNQQQVLAVLAAHIESEYGIAVKPEDLRVSIKDSYSDRMEYSAAEITSISVTVPSDQIKR